MSQSASHGTPLFGIAALLTLQLGGGVTPASVTDPATGVLLRGGLACLAGLPLDRVSINATAIVNASGFAGAFTFLATSATVNVATLEYLCYLDGARQLRVRHRGTDPALSRKRRASAQPISTAVVVGFLLQSPVALGAASLSSIPAAAPLLAALGPLLNSTSKPAVLAPFISAAANGSGVSADAVNVAFAASLEVLDLGPISGAAVTPPTSPGASSAGLSRQDTAGLAVGLAVACILLLAVLLWARARCQAQQRRTAMPSSVREAGAASPGTVVFFNPGFARGSPLSGVPPHLRKAAAVAAAASVAAGENGSPLRVGRFAARGVGGDGMRIVRNPLSALPPHVRAAAPVAGQRASASPAPRAADPSVVTPGRPAKTESMPRGLPPAGLAMDVTPPWRRRPL